MFCIELRKRGAPECVGCYVCAEVLNETDTLILRYFVVKQEEHNFRQKGTLQRDVDFAFRHRREMFHAVSPYMQLEKTAMYRSVTRLQQMRAIRQPEILEGRQSEFAATAKGDTVYRLKRMQIHGIGLDEKIQPFRHERFAGIAGCTSFNAA